MSASRTILACASVLAICVAAGPAVSQSQNQTKSAATAQPVEVVVVPDVDPAAFQALQRMGAYLNTLTAFEVKAETSADIVLIDDQKIKIDGVTTYRVRRPNQMVIENITDRKDRRFIYDGKTFTVFAPKKGYFATVDAPGTIREVLDTAYDKYGIVLPLQDLFYWSEPDANADQLTSAFRVGDSVIGGVAADHYAYSDGVIDWQIWIAKGDKPLPLKVVIIDPLDPSFPEYSARLAWNTSPRFTNQTFAFRPPQGANGIHLAAR